MYFRNYGIAKRHLDKYLKSAASQYPSTSNKVKVLKHISNHHGRTFIRVVDIDKDIGFEKVPLCDMKNVLTLC